MSIPARTAERTIGPAIGRYRTGPGHRTPLGFAPMASIACLSACVGSEAARRCGACESDLACWKRCTAVTDTTCLAGCLRT
jgi:hypothetical protein